MVLQSAQSEVAAMESLEHASNTELLSTLAGNSVAAVLMHQYLRRTGVLKALSQAKWQP